jgi:hypothetical protein
MNKYHQGDNSYTKSIKRLLAKLGQACGEENSLYGDATVFFNQQQDQQAASDYLKEQIRKAHAEPDAEAVKSARQSFARFDAKVQEQRLQRHSFWHKVGEDILDFIDGVTVESRRRNCARLLSTLLLISRSETGKPTRHMHSGLHLYRAVLSLLLLEQMLEEGLITNNYVLELARLRNNRGPEQGSRQCEFRSQIQLPLVMAALLQDIGLCHLRAEKLISEQESGGSEVAETDKEQRMALRKRNYQLSIAFLREAIGAGQYRGHSREERNAFNQQEKNKLRFIQTLLFGAVSTKIALGNLLKIPYLYTSFLLSSRCRYESLPNITSMMRSRAEKGLISKVAVACLIRIIGHFPPGYGIAYIPKHEGRYDIDKYEYAIVTGLYPESPMTPECRTVTRNMTFNAAGQDIQIKPGNNLYFPKARRKLEKIPRVKLMQILPKLNFDYEVRLDEGLIPSCWRPFSYFCYGKNQNLWNNSGSLFTAAA